MAVSLKKENQENLARESVSMRETSKSGNRDNPMTEKINKYSEQPRNKRERFAEKISDIWFDIREFFFGGFGGITFLTILYILLSYFLTVFNPNV